MERPDEIKTSPENKRERERENASAGAANGNASSHGHVVWTAHFRPNGSIRFTTAPMKSLKKRHRQPEERHDRKIIPLTSTWNHHALPFPYVPLQGNN